jgi:hypothetical protein
MLKRETFTIQTIYVPVKRRRTLDPKRVEEIAQSMLVDGQTTPILVRPDGARFVLVEGLHRLEAAKALGEQTIVGFRVAAGSIEQIGCRILSGGDRPVPVANLIRLDGGNESAEYQRRLTYALWRPPSRRDGFASRLTSN